MLYARCAPSGISVQNQFRIRSIWPNHAAGTFELGDELRPPVESCVRSNPKPPIEIGRLAFTERFVRGPQHRVTQSDRAIHPELAGIRTTVGEKIYKGLQKRLLHRRTVPVVDADDAAQSACLSIRGAGSSNGGKGSRMPSSSSIKTASPFRPGMRSGVLCQRELHLDRLLPYCTVSPLLPSTALCSAKFHRHAAGDFAKRLRSAAVARRRWTFCLATPKRSRHSTGE